MATETEQHTALFDAGRVQFALNALTEEFEYGSEWELSDAVPRRLEENPEDILFTLACDHRRPHATVYLQVCRSSVKLYAHYPEHKLVHYFACEPCTSGSSGRDLVAEAKDIYEKWRCPAKRKLFESAPTANAEEEDEEDVKHHILEELKRNSETIIESLRSQKVMLMANLQSLINEATTSRKRSRRDNDDEDTTDSDDDQATVEAIRQFIEYTGKIMAIAKNGHQALEIHNIIGEVIREVISPVEQM